MVSLPLRAFAADAPAAPSPEPAAASAAATATPEPAERVAPATLTIFNRPIVTLRSSFLGVTPAERAELARERIYSLLERGGPAKVSVVTIPQGKMIAIDGEYAFVIAQRDVPAGAGDTLDRVAVIAQTRLEVAVGETREARDTSLLTRAAIHSGIATVIFVAVLYGLVRLGRWLTPRVLRITHRTAGRMRVGGAAVLQRRRAFHAMHALLRAGGWFLFLLATYEWLGYVLARFPYTRPWGEQLNGFLLGTAEKILIAVAKAAPELLVAIIVFVIAHWIDRVQKAFFESVENGRVRVSWVDRDTARPSRKLVTMAVWVFAVVMAYPYIPGSDTDAFKGLSVLLGLMVSVGASGLVGQAASGLILMYTRTFRVGEYVRVGDAEGTVVAMGMFTTHLRTGMGEELTLPNATVLTSTTHNFSRPARGQGFTLTVQVTIGYDAPWRQVEAMLVNAARKTHGVLPWPEPRVYVHALSDFYVEYRLVAQGDVNDPQLRAGILSALHTSIIDEFNLHGVQIMSPHYLGDPAQEKVVPQADWYKAPAGPPPAA
ncbi:MAG: mechanosensitive ion channel [Burkholderiales bacterium]